MTEYERGFHNAMALNKSAPTTPTEDRKTGRKFAEIAKLFGKQEV